jgi:S-methylmethionine-dependent homocysteine/selenocysteine methylase
VSITLLDGPIGTELARRGFEAPLPLWSAAAIDEAPELLGAIHADYAAAGATVHTACSFRTDAWTLRKLDREDDCERLSRRAVEIARSAVPGGHAVAGSISPLEDCYEPASSPSLAICRVEHARSAHALVLAGVDLLLCETFPHPGEALAALDAALEHDVPVWLSLSPGPEGTLLSDEVIIETLTEAVRRGAEAVLVNCAPLDLLSRLLPDLAGLDVQFGAYGNVGRPCSKLGWINEGEALPEPYAEAAAHWLEAGASILGGCCGTGPAHIASLDRLVKDWKKAVELRE